MASSSNYNCGVSACFNCMFALGFAALITRVPSWLSATHQDDPASMYDEISVVPPRINASSMHTNRSSALLNVLSVNISSGIPTSALNGSTATHASLRAATEPESRTAAAPPPPLPPPALPMPQAPPSRVAVAYRGHYCRSSSPNQRVLHGGCSDFFLNIANHEATVFAPLRAAGAAVDVYFVTYRSRLCAARDAALVSRLAPRAHRFDDPAKPRLIQDQMLDVLALVAAAADADFVLLLRFDVDYRRPLTDLGLDWGRLTLPFRQCRVDEATGACLGWGLRDSDRGTHDIHRAHKTTDLFFALPRRLAPALVAAFRASLVRVSSQGVEFFYDELVAHPAVGGEEGVTFVESAFVCSRTHFDFNVPEPDIDTQGRNCNRTQPPGGLFLGINRACGSAQRALACDPANLGGRTYFELILALAFRFGIYWRESDLKNRSRI